MVPLGGLVASAFLASSAQAATLYVAKTGSDAGSNRCNNQAMPCATIAQGLSSMAAGDTLIVGDGTYTEDIRNMPSGSASAYTTVRAANDWGVLIDGSGWANNYRVGIRIESKHHVIVRGFRVKMNQAADTNEPIMILSSDHIKLQRCSGSHAPTNGNAATIDIGPAASYVLIEEVYAFGGARYQFVVYQSDHVIVRRSVARHDYWDGDLQCAGFTNYDSTSTVWQNNIVLDSDTANCRRNLYGGFFHENKDDFAPDTSSAIVGSIILNVKAFYAGDLDWVASGTHTLQDTIIWGGTSGYYGDQGSGVSAHVTATRLTLGGLSGRYDGPNNGAAQGTGFSVYGNLQNSLTNSILSACNSLGIADYTMGDYNAYSGNGANYGGVHKATAGAHDITDDSVTRSLRYLPRVEAGSPLKTAGSGGGQVGAEIMFMTGATGSLYGEAGWDQLTTQPLWPFPNEDQIRKDMAAYNGPGGVGARGFATGNSRDGSPQTLTKYIWEYLGNQIPPEIYGFHIATESLPDAIVGRNYSETIAVAGGTSPHTWSMTGTLPAGLTLDTTTGTISGTPTAVGSATITVTVTDAASPAKTTTKSLSINVTAVPTTGAAGTSGSGAGGRGGSGAGGSGTGVGGSVTGAGGSSPGTGGTMDTTGAGGTVDTTGAGGTGNTTGTGGRGVGAKGAVTGACSCQMGQGAPTPLAGLMTALGALVLTRRRRRS